MPETKERKRAPGGGRKPLPAHEVKKRRIFWLNEAEYNALLQKLTEIRGKP